MNGNIGCFTGWHIPLALLAIAVLVAAVLFVPLVCLISIQQHLIKVCINFKQHIILNLWYPSFMQSLYWWKYFQDALTVTYKEKWKWWSAVELARRFIFILFVVSYPRNSVSDILLCFQTPF